ncbi:DUF421 domain-containing protein [Bacillaceae bacterium W0354]
MGLEILEIFLRTIGIYLAIFIAFRFMGKREVGELSIMDLVVYILLAEIGILAIENRDKNFFMELLPMLIIVLIQILSARISIKSNTVRDFFEGKAEVIIKNGNIDEQAMKKQRYNMDDLLMQLREQGIFDLSQVQLAILETNGKLSVFEKKENPPSVIDPIIVDGEIHKETLKQLNLTEKDIINMLKQQGISDYTKISLAQMNNQGKLHIDYKDS